MPRKKTPIINPSVTTAVTATSLTVPRSQTLGEVTILPTQILGIPSRHPSARGPWSGEPDRIAWCDARTGLDCLILRQPDGTLSGYVAVPPSHPLAGYRYDAVPSDIRSAAHRGLGYAQPCDRTAPEPVRVCHDELAFGRRVRPAVDVAEHGLIDAWWFGFDTAHPGDLVPIGTKPERHFEEGEVYRDIHYVADETRKLAEALMALANPAAPIDPLDVPATLTPRLGRS